MRWSYLLSFFFFLVILKWIFFSINLVNFLDFVQVDIKLYRNVVNWEMQIKTKNIPS